MDSVLILSQSCDYWAKAMLRLIFQNLSRYMYTVNIIFLSSMFNYSSLSYIVFALSSAVTKLPNTTLIFHDFQGPPIKFHDFPGLENEFINPTTFQVFHDLYEPCLSWSLPLFAPFIWLSIRRMSLWDRHSVPVPKVSLLERTDCIQVILGLAQLVECLTTEQVVGLIPRARPKLRVLK